MPDPNPTTHLSLQELHDELGRLLGSHLMPDTLTNVTRVVLDGAGLQRVSCEVADQEEGLPEPWTGRELARLERDLENSEITIDDLRAQIEEMNRKLAAK